VLALTITAFLGASLWNVIGALAVTFVPTFAFLVRGEVLTLATRDFVTAAQALGAARFRVMWRHLLPNLSDVLLVQASFGIGTAILTEASLSFLGLGVPPPALSWGRMLREGYSFILEAPWLSLAAGGAIFLIALASQMVADPLQGILARGPELRGPRPVRGPASARCFEAYCPRERRRSDPERHENPQASGWTKNPLDGGLEGP
jgi:peptide/nickel transport system permease protein